MITNETIRQSTDVQQDEKDAIKMAWEWWTTTDWPKVYTTSGRHPGKDQEDDGTKDGWTVLKRIYDEQV